MDIVCSTQETDLFERISKTAQLLDVECYIVGGFVRDKILGRPTKDVDIVCTGDGIAMAQAVADTYRHKPTVSFFKNFGTAHFRVHGFDVEFVGARKESYVPESRKPEVSPGWLGFTCANAGGGASTR